MFKHQFIITYKNVLSKNFRGKTFSSKFPEAFDRIGINLP